MFEFRGFLKHQNTFSHTKYALGADKDGDVFISPSLSQTLNLNSNHMGLYQRHFKHNLRLIGLQQSQQLSNLW